MKLKTGSLLIPLFLITFLIFLDGCQDDTVTITTPVSAVWNTIVKTNESITLSWKASSSSEQYNYILLKLSEESDWTPENGTEYSLSSGISGLLYSGTDTSYSDLDITKGSIYIYKLFAADKDFTYADPIEVKIKIEDSSSDGSSDTGNISVVYTPTLEEAVQKNYYISLKWEETNSEASSFIVARSISPITWEPVTGTSYSAGDIISGVSIIYSGTDTSYRDTEINNGQTYYYKIFAFNSDKLYSVGIQSKVYFEEEADLEYDRFDWVDNYIIYYGTIDDNAINTLKKYDLAIIHPNNNGDSLTRAKIKKIQRGVDTSDPDDDVIVIGYIAVGEDL
ncbi:MAG: hypothetical protein PQJ46_12470, partial [Spirochaetales bacterium]|nr:hypothetical protein [Spirochaetales bacterium]